ncbi:MAG: hypothetical protein ACLGSH_02975, partial [Acidobacteriota bacterium]
MRPRTLVFITLLALCHPFVEGQALTNVAPAARPPAPAPASAPAGQESVSALPDDPGQELLPRAKPVPPPLSGTPVE